MFHVPTDVYSLGANTLFCPDFKFVRFYCIYVGDTVVHVYR